MKKSLSALSAVVMATTAIAPATVFAAEVPAPVFYMSVLVDGKIEVLEDGVVQINPEQLKGGLNLLAGIFFKDTTKTAWSVSPRWKSDSEYIKITQLHNPLDDLTEYAYTEKDENGNIAKMSNEYDYSLNSKYNTHNLTIRNSTGNALKPYGENSDAYPLITFDFTIDENTPEGEYEIFFATYDDNTTRAALAITGAPIFRYPDNPPEVKNLKIVIGSPNDEDNLGDINLDGNVDSSDASAALADFALVATGGTSPLTVQQKLNGDVNEDGKIDATDASSILTYYAYLSTTKDEVPMTLREFLAK